MIINGQEIEVYTLDDDGQEVDRAVNFGKNPDALPIEDSEVGVKSGGIFTAIKEAKETLEAKIVNRNLLHNPYFKIDQRQGYVVPPNKNYYSDTSLSTLVGQTSEYVTVTAKASGYNTINIGGTDYYAAVADCVRGYCEKGYTVDMWKLDATGGVVLIHDDYIEISQPNDHPFVQYFELDRIALGETVTLSVKWADNTITTGTGTIPSTLPADWTAVVSVQGATMYISPTRFALDFWGSKNIKAVKLEYGSISTLQAEIDSGAYDEVVDREECELRFRRIHINSQSCIGGKVYGSDRIRLGFPMRFAEAPTVVPKAASDFYGSYNGAYQTVSQIGNLSTADFVGLDFVCTGATWSDNNAGAVTTFNDTYIDLSCELV